MGLATSNGQMDKFANENPLLNQNDQMDKKEKKFEKIKEITPLNDSR